MKKQVRHYLVQTFGCQMNHSDSERFAAILERIGYAATEAATEADLIIYNSCSVRQKAEDRILGQGSYISKLKRKNPDLKVVLTGCMARRTWKGTSKTGSPIQMTQSDRETELQTQMPWVDIVIETKDFAKLPGKLGFDVNISEAPEHYLSYKPVYKNDFQTFVPISTGCDHFCTFCIVPFARGGEVCRKADSIIDEVEERIANGTKDLTLLGQTVNRWVNPKYDEELKQGMIANTRIPELNNHLMADADCNDPKDFLQLMQRLDQIPGDWWMSFVSSHPNYMTDELIDFIAESKHIRPYLHFALQSGSDEILKRMNRRHTIDEFVAKTLRMKDKIPGLGLSTDVIVGFPGETEEQFMQTADVMNKLGFDMAYISEFSPRKGTAAGLLKDDISREEKSRRKKYLNDEILAKTAGDNNNAMLNTKQKVLITGKDRNGKIKGRTANNKDTTVTGVTTGLGSFVSAEITACTPWALTAKALK